jgi:multidrug efflux system membrane fusion protein
MNPQLTRSMEKLAEPPAARKAPRKKRLNVVPWLICVVLLGAAGYAAWKFWAPMQAYFTTPIATSTGGRGRGAGGNIPVVAATARRGMVHIYLDGLGQVTPLATVSLKTRVDGQIMKINYVEGQLVNEGDLLMEIDPRPYQVQLEQAQGQMLKDKAYLANAKLDLTRYQVAGAAVSDQQLATQQSLVDQYEATVVSDQSQIDAAQLQLVYCKITSPITGRIGLRQVDVGNIVHAADTTSVAVITQLQPITVVFSLPEDDLGQVVGAANGGVGLAVAAYDREDQHQVASGAVSAVDNQVDPTTGTFKIKATFANQDNALFPSEFVNAHLLASIERNQILVPTAAVQHGPDGGAFVWLIKRDGTVTLTNVTEGDGEQDFEAVTGIQPGDVVVTDGTDKLQEGSKVTATMTDFGGVSTGGPTTRTGRGGRGAGRSTTRRSISQ